MAFESRRRGQQKRRSLTDVGLVSATASAKDPGVRAERAPGEQARIRGIQQFARRGHTAQAQQIYLQQEAAAERAKSSAFGRGIQERQLGRLERGQEFGQGLAERQQKRLEQGQEFSQGLAGRQQGRLEQGQEFSQGLAERKLAQQGELGRRRLDIAGRPKAVKPVRTLPKQPSKTPTFFIEGLNKIAPDAADFISRTDDEGLFVNAVERNTFMDALDIFAQRNPQATDEEAVRYASGVAAFAVKPPAVAPAQQKDGGSFSQQLESRPDTDRPFTGQRTLESRPDTDRPFTGQRTLGVRRGADASPYQQTADAVPSRDAAQEPQTRKLEDLPKFQQMKINRMNRRIGEARQRGNQSIVRNLTRERDKILTVKEPRKRREIKPRTIEQETRRLAKLAKKGLSTELLGFVDDRGITNVRNKTLKEVAQGREDLAAVEEFQRTGPQVERLSDQRLIGAPPSRAPERPTGGIRQLTPPQAVPEAAPEGPQGMAPTQGATPPQGEQMAGRIKDILKTGDTEDMSRVLKKLKAMGKSGELTRDDMLDYVPDNILDQALGATGTLRDFWKRSKSAVGIRRGAWSGNQKVVRDTLSRKYGLNLKGSGGTDQLRNALVVGGLSKEEANAEISRTYKYLNLDLDDVLAVIADVAAMRTKVEQKAPKRQIRR